MASCGVLYEESYVKNARGVGLFTCRWFPANRESKALIFLCHGYAMECSVYTRETGIRLARAGYAVFGIDYEGHGKSEGLKAYIPSFDDLVTDCETYFTSIMDREEYIGKQSFLYGESMGGTVSILMSRKTPGRWNGMVLVAPMCKIADNMRLHPILVALLHKVAYFFPTWKIVPTKDIISLAFKDPIKQNEIRSNPLAYKGAPRLKTGVEMIKACTEIEQSLDEVSIPFLCLHGEDDKVTDPEASKSLYESSTSHDKTLKLYPGMWHGLTAGEPEDNVDRVFRDITSWLNERVVSDVSRSHLRSTSITAYDEKLGSMMAEFCTK